MKILCAALLLAATSASAAAVGGSTRSGDVAPDGSGPRAATAGNPSRVAQAVPGAGNPRSGPAPVNPALVNFYRSALGDETVLQFAACAGDAQSFVFALDTPWTGGGAGDSITVGCLDGRGEPNSTAIVINRYNQGRALPTHIVNTGEPGEYDSYNLWKGNPTTNDDYYVGPVTADSARAAIAAGAAEIRRERAAAAANRASEEFTGPCP